MKNDIWVRSANGRKAHSYFIADTQKLCFEGEEVTVEELERAMKIIRSVKAEKNSSYKSGYVDAQRDILYTLAKILMSVGGSSCDLGAFISRFRNTGYGNIIELELLKSGEPFKYASIAYPECLSNPNILVHSLNEIFEELKGGEEK